jgi:hypothetical protein
MKKDRMMQRIVGISTFILFLFLVTFATIRGAKAQMLQPFIEGDGINVEASSVRCLPHKNFKTILEQKKMHIIITGEFSNALRVIFANSDGDIVVSNIFPNDKACILEIIEHAAIAKEIEIPKPPREKPDSVQ